MKQNLAVLFGQFSCEHDISIITACQAMKNINKDKYQIIPIYCTKENTYLTGIDLMDIENYPDKVKDKEVTILPNSNFLYYKKGKRLKKGEQIDVALFCFHGHNGEDGAMQGLFELNGIPYTSIGVMGSSVASDKVLFKQLLNGLNIPNVYSMWLELSDYYENKDKNLTDIIKDIQLPLIVKPSNLGSSIGVSVCNNEFELKNALDLAFELDDRVLIEKYLKDIKEINVAVLFDGSEYIYSEFEEVIHKEKILSFENKYIYKSGKKMTRSVASYLGGNIKAKLSVKDKKTMRMICDKICNVLNLKGVVRFDYMISNGDIFLNEINTIPGSLSNYLFIEKYTYTELLDTLINASILNQSKKESITHVFNSSVLSGYHSNKLK